MVRKLSLIMAALSCTACVKGVTGFDLLDSSAIPQPMFSGNTETTVQVTTSSQEVDITGQCDSKIRSITAQAKDVMTSQGTLDDVSTSPASVQCKNSPGTFSFRLKSLTALGFTPVDGRVYEIELRGLTSAGLSRPSVIYVLFSNPNNEGPRGMAITSGSTEGGGQTRRASGSNFKAVVRVEHREPTLATGSNYKAVVGTSLR